MPSELQAFIQLLQQDQRYRLEAYQFVREALNYAQEVLQLPCQIVQTEKEEKQKHLTGQQLCEAIRIYAIDQYGYLAKLVLNHWGIKETGDFGEIVYNLIRVNQMRKSRTDRREDFDNVYDFDEAFQPPFEALRQPSDA